MMSRSVIYCWTLICAYFGCGDYGADAAFGVCRVMRSSEDYSGGYSRTEQHSMIVGGSELSYSYEKTKG